MVYVLQDAVMPLILSEQNEMAESIGRTPV